MKLEVFDDRRSWIHFGVGMLILMYPVSAASLDDTIKQHILNDVLSYIRGSIDKNHVLDEVMRYIDLVSEDKAQIGTFVADYDFDHNGRITHHDYPKIAEDYLHGNLTVAQLNTIKWILNEYDGYIFKAADEELLLHYITKVPPAWGKLEYLEIYVNDTFVVRLETEKVSEGWTKNGITFNRGFVYLKIVDYNPEVFWYERNGARIIKIPEGATLTAKGRLTYLDGTPVPKYFVEAWWDFEMGRIKHADITYEYIEKDDDGYFTITIGSEYFNWSWLEKYELGGCNGVLWHCTNWKEREKPLNLCNRTIYNYMSIYAVHFAAGTYNLKYFYDKANSPMGYYIKRHYLKPPYIVFNYNVNPYAVCKGGG